MGQDQGQRSDPEENKNKPAAEVHSQSDLHHMQIVTVLLTGMQLFALVPFTSPGRNHNLIEINGKIHIAFNGHDFTLHSIISNVWLDLSQ